MQGIAKQGPAEELHIAQALAALRKIQNISEFSTVMDHFCEKVSGFQRLSGVNYALGGHLFTATQDSYNRKTETALTEAAALGMRCAPALVERIPFSAHESVLVQKLTEASFARLTSATMVEPKSSAVLPESLEAFRTDMEKLAQKGLVHEDIAAAGAEALFLDRQTKRLVVTSWESLSQAQSQTEIAEFRQSVAAIVDALR